MVQCCIIGCKSRSERKHENITFHTFPNDEKVRDAWVKATGRLNWKPTANTRICSKHFETRFFRKTLRKVFLDKSAFPKLWIHNYDDKVLNEPQAATIQQDILIVSPSTADNTSSSVQEREAVVIVKSWCLDLGIPEVTVYAFSIENFKRSEEEVCSLMELAREKFQKLLEEITTINEWGVRIHVAGRLTLLPEDLRKLVSKAMLATRHNNKLRLNIAYAYTGRDEISRAASHIVNGIKSNELLPADIDEDLITQSLELNEPELLVRTSGEVRLSDFMLWQVSNSVLYFTNVLWPEFTIWNLLAAIIHFQRHAPTTKSKCQITDSKQTFLDDIENRRWQEMERFLNC